MSDPPVLPGLQFVRSLGKGGYAEVYLYEQMSPRMRVAVKVMFLESLSPELTAQFTEEGNTMAELAGHPYIVDVFHSDVTADGRPYIVMKYYPQRNLAERSQAERISVPEVLQIGVRVASAVETAHRADILHRDIKPANILTSQYGEPGLTDFGIATSIANRDVEDALSPPWAAPEVVLGMAPAGVASDVYSLGATLWHLFVGHSPFELPGGDNGTLALHRRIKDSPPPRTGRDDVPESLERLLGQAMAKSPDARPQSALEFARGLQAIEYEHRWVPTPLVLLEEEGYIETGDETLADSSSATRRRAITPIEIGDLGDTDREELPTRRRLVVISPSVAAPSRGPSEVARKRQGMPVTGDSTTIQRPNPATPASVQEPTPVPSGRWLGVLVIVVAAAILVAVVLILATSGKSPHDQPPPTSGSTLTTGSASQPGPNVVRVEGRRSGRSDVRFTWVISHLGHGSVSWATSRSGPSHLAASDHALVRGGSPVCIFIDVHATNGQVSSSGPYCFRSRS